jgi:Flp pilus assembly protein TadG
MNPTVASTRARDRRHRQRGAAMVELALITAVLSMVILGAIDFGRIGHHAMALSNAARAGAIHGAQPGKYTDFAGMQSAASTAAAADIGSITAAASLSCECQVGSGTPTVITCGSVCTGTLRRRVSVTASKTFSMISTVPGVRKTVNVSRTVVMRAQ